MSAAMLLRQARRASRLSQRALAARAGARQPGIAAIESGAHDTSVGTLGSLLAAAGYRLAAIPTLSQTAAETAEAVHESLQEGNESAAFRQLLQLNDDLAREHGPLRLVLSVAPPALVGDRRFDAFLAALVEHHLAAEELPVPSWTSEPERTAKPVWFVVDLPAYCADAYRTSPITFVRHGVFVNADDLVSV
jgi:transcriptional regulator with XRE-family HTH domain